MMNIKLAILFTKLAHAHGQKILHANNPELLTRDLGLAMRRQKEILSDPHKSPLMTAYDVLPLMLEIKVLGFYLARRLDIETKDRNISDVLGDIAETVESRPGGKLYTKDVRETLEWTRALFAHPEIQDLMKMEKTPIDLPKTVGDAAKFARQVAGRSQDEITHALEFIRRVKEAEVKAKSAPRPKKPAKRKKPPTPRA